MQIEFFIILLTLSYIIGSIPFGLIIVKAIKGIDIREHGSRNIGATNVGRVVGGKIAFLVFLADMTKGALPILIAKALTHFNVLNLSYINGFNILIFYGLAAVLGNVFSCFIKFKGGKAVATTAGVMLALNPIVALISIVIFVMIGLLTGYISLASVMSGITCFTFQVLDTHFNWFNQTYTFESQVFVIIGVGLIILFLLIKHIPNMIRLAKGTERRFNIGLVKYLNNRKNKNLNSNNDE